MRCNSTIREKIGECADCVAQKNDHKYKTLIAGRCAYHYQRHRAVVRSERRKDQLAIGARFNAKIKDASTKKRTRDLTLITPLERWFRNKRLEMTGVCVNCGGRTNKDDQRYYKFCIAHILPKKKEMFPSVLTNQHNWIELCYFGNSCHSKYDSDWEAASKMLCFEEAKRKFELFKDNIAEEEKRKIPECFTGNNIK